MRRIIIVLCMCSIALLAACSENSSGSGSKPNAGGPNTTDTVGKMYEQQFGDLIFYYRTNSVTKVTSKVAFTISDPVVVTERGGKQAEDLDSDTDYVKVYVTAENVGDENSFDLAVSWSRFDVYDANGKEISKLIWVDEYLPDEFEPVELRPGGKNEGYMYIPFEEGKVPVEIIYYDSTIRGSYTNQFVFKL